MSIANESIRHKEAILTADAVAFLEELHRKFNPRRLELLDKRVERQKEINSGKALDFAPETKAIREDDSWRVAKTPADLQKRLVEITGPTDRKMVINALNSGADVFMADFEDANSPTFFNMVEGQQNLIDAVNKTISFKNPDGKEYRLNEEIAHLFVRPRGWHLNEKHFKVDGEEIAGGIFDFALFFFHNAKRLVENGATPSFYLPKMEHYLEARLWSDIFTFAEEYLGIDHGTIRATVLIETLPAAFQMDEILYELKDYSAGLNAGRWDYIFSAIKTFQSDESLLFPSREQVTMTVPFMRAYALLLVKTCHKRGAHAMGGMAAFIPNKSDPEATERALRKVKEDKQREATDGFDGTWVAHPGLVSIARDEFVAVLQDKPNQKEKQRDDVTVGAQDLLDFEIPGGSITMDSLVHNVDVSLQYLYFWLKGRGAAALYNLMEDMATAEISRSQIWQWLARGASFEDGTKIDKALVEKIIKEEEERIGKEYDDPATLDLAAKMIGGVVFESRFVPFLTEPAYKVLN